MKQQIQPSLPLSSKVVEPVQRSKNKHYTHHHSSQANYQCFCQKRYLSYPALSLHVNKKHQNFMRQCKGMMTSFMKEVQDHKAKITINKLTTDKQRESKRFRRMRRTNPEDKTQPQEQQKETQNQGDNQKRGVMKSYRTIMSKYEEIVKLYESIAQEYHLVIRKYESKEESKNGEEYKEKQME